MSSDPHILGIQGEQIAAEYLSKRGYRIIRRNYRYRRNEIDIIAKKHSTLCFVEVKTRASLEKGHPAEAVTLKKQKEIIKAAKSYLFSLGTDRCDCRFDVIAILVRSMKQEEIGVYDLDHFTDAFQAE
ncbi:MAG: YraN family protein [Chlorobiaceae bacterium]|jgi:putative endonuclease|nr:YraN family protein [Chlorobiaceae bacterium]